MDKAPISFKHRGKEFKAFFSEINGAGDTTVWYLDDVKGYYLGRLRLSHGEWVFDESRPADKLGELAQYFGDFITAWIQ